ncbi:hypothetical protein SSX86_027790 [Deinandra increscens subsp. villosa]|uniref:F-box domain-containing protein n=1 Tax=Deinandra increscens subsp. villosa TaxID=3103831 RepID=A0AAP0GK68_9ASTR
MYISNMPENVVTNILNRLPLQYAVRTGILSRDWRFKWTMLSELVLDEKFIDYLIKRAGYRESRRIINRLLPNFQCAITKFVIYLNDDRYDIEKWILFLSKKGVEDLTICNEISQQALQLPNHFFSFLELKHLNLDNCCFNPPASFQGFPNLLSLELCKVKFESGKFGEFFTQCPELEILNMSFPVHAHVKLVEIAKLTNLKILSLFMFNMDYTMITSSSVIFELLGFLPKLQELELDFRFCRDTKAFTEDGARKKSPSSFPCLMTLKLSEIDLGSGMMSSFAFELIRSSPNLQTLEITADSCSTEDDPRERFPTTFPCLKTLKISSMDLWSGNMLSFTFEVIRSSPNLQTLEIAAPEWDSERSPAILSPEVDYNTMGTLELSFTEDGAAKWPPNTFSFLKTLKLSNIHVRSGVMLSFASIIIRSSSILQTLEITVGGWFFTEVGATFPCLKNLKLSDIYFGSGSMLSSAFEMIRSSPSLHTLEISSADSYCNEDGERKRSPATFPCLKTLKLSNIDLGSDIMVSFSFDIIRSSPNLQTLEITAGYWGVSSPLAICSPDVDYNALGLLQLRSVIFTDLKHSENEVVWIKYLLACSPFLEKICIHLEPDLSSDAKLMFAKKLLKLHRASAVVDIDLY